MERCPCCNARLNLAEACPRCKTNLSALFATETAAKYWLSQGIKQFKGHDLEQSIKSIERSIQLKTTHLAIKFRHYLIQQQCQSILFLLAENKIMQAKRELFIIRRLFPFSQQLQQINQFSDYLLIKQQD